MYLRPPASAPGPGPQGRNRIPSWIEMPQDKPGALEVGVQEGYIFVLLSSSNGGFPGILYTVPFISRTYIKLADLGDPDLRRALGPEP